MPEQAEIRLPPPNVLARTAPDTFARWASGGAFKVFRHIGFVGKYIATEVAAGGGRLIVNMPPGHGKSQLTSRWTPTWFLDQWPDRRVIVAGHGSDLASDWGRTVRNEFENNPHLLTRLRQDSTAADRWHTPEGGGMKTAGVGGGITGFRANLILIDDPHPTWEAAQSPTHRRRVAEWFDGTLADRAEPDATIILLMHRWHPDDLVGHLLHSQPDRWRVLRLPALAEDRGDPLGRQPGEALCPERFDTEALEQVRATTPAGVWASKYQQNPLEVGSGRAYPQYLPERNNDSALTMRPGLAAHVSFDFNYNPGMHSIIGQYDPAADVFSAVHEVHGPYMRLPACLDAVKRILAKAAADNGGRFPWPELCVFGDPAGNQNRAEVTHTAWQQVRNALEPFAAAYGVPFRLKVPAGQYPVRTRLETFNEALCDPAGNVHYRIHPGNCPRLAADLAYLKTDDAGLIDKSDDKLSHAAEAEANRVVRLRPIRRVATKIGRVGVAGGSMAGRVG